MISTIENFLPLIEQNNIENLINSDGFPWYLSSQTAKGVAPGSIYDKKTKDSFQLNHMIFSKGIYTSLYHRQLFFLIKKTSELFNGYKLARLKLNLNPKDSGYDKNCHFVPHIDNHLPDAITCIYYVNDTDGDTFFYKTPEKDFSSENELEIIETKTPKKGNFVYFDSSIWHSGQPPIKSNYRLIINMNWEKIK